MKCKVCGTESNFFGRATVLRKHTVSYYRCPACEFIQTENPFWIYEAYIKTITDQDVGLVKRNLHLAMMSKTILTLFFDGSKPFVDFAGGYGLFVRRMRDLGFDFYWTDRYCENVFSKGFEYIPAAQEEIEAVTAFEVFEHLNEPIDEIQKILSISNNILFTTELIPKTVPKPGEWWYYGLQHGQHISFYSTKTLQVIADRFGLQYYSNGKYFHLFSIKKILKGVFAIISQPKTAKLLSFMLSRKSRLPADFEKFSKIIV